jgi:hypothetical protein
VCVCEGGGGGDASEGVKGVAVVVVAFITACKHSYYYIVYMLRLLLVRINKSISTDPTTIFTINI